MLDTVDSTIRSIRAIASELRPSILDDLGLLDAIEWQAQQFQAKTGIVCRLQSSSDQLQLSALESTAIFRILQEALTNILRHARASSVHIAVELSPSEFSLKVSDNGRGIIAVEKSGLGILGMQERARLVGGEIKITGLRGIGTTISLKIPMSVTEISHEENSHC